MNRTLVNSKLFPKRAVIIYGSNSDYRDLYLENRDIESINGQYVFSAPTPLPEKVLKDIAKLYEAKATLSMDFAGIMPEHMLYASNKPGKLIVIWYRPSMKRKLNFLPALGIGEATTLEIPATLYMVLNGTFYVFALADNTRPNPKTKLYRAPFFNTYEDGNICLGSAPIGKTRAATFEAEAERYERGFYVAEQTHTNTSKTCKSSLVTVWKTLAKTKKPFPVDELLQHPRYKTLQDLLTNKASF